MPRGRRTLDLRKLARLVGQTLARLRAARGLSQEQLALQLGVSRSTVSRWESGAVALAVVDLVRVARVLDCPTAELVPWGRP